MFIVVSLRIFGITGYKAEGWRQATSFSPQFYTGISKQCVSCHSRPYEVADGSKGKKVMIDDGVDILKELEAISNLDDLS
ncbi:unnamed protein product [Lactuca virosa]|uniref:Cytochrome c domain-containing protein n=1 Tax=Lactuca virosa TaxID=75947 RepID=A0AAU9MA56_9ASTR|nr:unnamed protein product [Lactuca virosa]